MDILFKKSLMRLLIWVLRFLDSIFGAFRQLAGIEPIQTQDGESDILKAFLGNDIITSIFLGILVVSAVVCGVCMITAIVKAMFSLTDGERKSIAKIVMQGISVIYITLAMAIITTVGVVFANKMLAEIHKTFSGGAEQSLSETLFDISVEKSVKYTYDYMNPDTGQVVYETNEDGEFLLDEDGNKIKHVFGYTTEVTDSGWHTQDGKMPPEFDIDTLTADQVYGIRKKNVFGVEKSDTNPQGNYWLYLDSFNFLTGYFGGVILLVAVCFACLGLVKRLYDIVVLFLALPLMVATIPLDDGARFKVWRETVVSKVIIAYGAIFSVNVFLLMMPVIQGFAMPPIFQLLLIIGGGLSISGGMLLFARLFGTDAAESRDLAQSARTLIAGGMAAKGGMEWAGRATGLTKDKDGRRTGLLGFAGKLAQHHKGRNNSLSNAVNRELSGGGSGSGGAGTYTGGVGAMAAAGSSLGKALATAGVRQEVIYRNTANGRIVSAKQAAEMTRGGNSQSATDTASSGVSSSAGQTNSNSKTSGLQNRMKFKNPVQQK